MRFICPNGTLFSQETQNCDYWFNVNCNENIEQYGTVTELNDSREDFKLEPLPTEQPWSEQSIGASINIIENHNDNIISKTNKS